MSFILSGLIVTCIAAVLFFHGVRSFILGDNTECYGDLGCFSSSGPFAGPFWHLSSVPSSPDHIRTKFILFTRDNKVKEQALDARKLKEAKTTWTKFKDRPTKFIIHGYIDDIDIVSWMGELKDELLIHGDYNTIIVDWHHGNTPPYVQAAANTRVVGAQVALLIKQLQTDFSVKPGQIHIIGHSLGAHISGYAGERIVGLGRITGLDPAAPLFSGTDKVVRLDSTDALFVDSIHSDTNPFIKLAFGMKEAVGHMDFYPNLGHDQPGCQRDLTNLISITLSDGPIETVACNHLRAIKFFKESINSICPFLAFPCNSEEDFKNHKCHTCSEESCASMGFKADKYKPKSGEHVKYYLITGDSAPFCQYHRDVKVRLATNKHAKAERGTMSIRLHSKNKGISKWLQLDKKPIYYYPGKTYERMVGITGDFGDLSSVEFKWHHTSSYTDLSSWNILGVRNPTLYLHGIDIMRVEQGQLIRFCADDIAVENNIEKSIFKPCSRKRNVGSL